MCGGIYLEGISTSEADAMAVCGKYSRGREPVRGQVWAGYTWYFSNTYVYFTHVFTGKILPCKQASDANVDMTPGSSAYYVGNHHLSVVTVNHVMEGFPLLRGHSCLGLEATKSASSMHGQ